MIYIEKVNKKTFFPVIDMKVSQEQEQFVASNIMSLAQAWLYHENARPLVIMNDDEPVGFMMLDWDEKEKTVGIWRMMIDIKHQGKGYGKHALQAIIDQVKKENKFDKMYLSIIPENEVARKLYKSLGFNETGEIDDGEEIMVLPLNN